MEGVRAYDCVAFHPSCTDVEVVDVGGFAHLWCKGCRVLANMEAVSTKFQTYQHACASEPAVKEAPHG